MNVNCYIGVDKQYIEPQILCILLQITCLYKRIGGVKQFTSVPCTPNIECIAHQLSVHGTPKNEMVCIAHSIWCASLDDADHNDSYIWYMVYKNNLTYIKIKYAKLVVENAKNWLIIVTIIDYIYTLTIYTLKNLMCNTALRKTAFCKINKLIISL